MDFTLGKMLFAIEKKNQFDETSKWEDLSDPEVYKYYDNASDLISQWVEKEVEDVFKHVRTLVIELFLDKKAHHQPYDRIEKRLFAKPEHFWDGTNIPECYRYCEFYTGRGIQLTQFYKTYHDLVQAITEWIKKRYWDNTEDALNNMHQILNGYKTEFGVKRHKTKLEKLGDFKWPES